MRLTWRPQALQDLESARRHIAAENPSASRRVMRAILAAVAHLPATPHIGRPGRVSGARERVIPQTPYIVAYTVIEAELVILAVLHGAREWPETF